MQTQTQTQDWFARCRWTMGMLVLLGAVLGLASCGGGGGSSSSSSPAPTGIAAQPTSVSAVTGAGATFSVVATGDGLSYQWQRSTDGGASFTAIAGATGASYSIATVDSSLNGSQYRVVVSGIGGSITSSAVTLTVAPSAVAPTITTQPAPQSVAAGGTASFSVTAAGTSLTYQWQSSPDGVAYTNVSGATNATLTLAGVTMADSGRRFRVIVGNGSGSVTSSGALLTVASASTTPVIATQPASTSVVAPATATFTVVASGSPTPSYQWQLSTDGGVTYADIAGATDSTYTTPPTVNADSGKRFRVNVTNSLGSLLSASAVLTVSSGSAPAVSVQPTSQGAYTTTNDFGAPHTATFSASATGTPTPTLQWQISVDNGSTFTNITGATLTTYTTSSVTTSDDNAQFRIVASNTLGVSRSRAATLHVANIGFGAVPTSLAVSSSGDVHSTVQGFSTLNTYPFAGEFMGVRVIHADRSVTTLAGGPYGSGADVDGPGPSARFNFSTFRGAIALDASGNVYVSDAGNRIRKISAGGVVTTLAGSDPAGGFVDGVGLAASFNDPRGVAVDASGNVYVSDRGNAAIRKITPAGVVSTFAGGTAGFADGTGTAARFGAPLGITIDAAGNLYVIDDNHVASGGVCAVRKISPTGSVTTLVGGAGTASACSFTPSDGPIATAKFYFPDTIAVDGSGNIYLGETRGGIVRKISPSGVASTVTGLQQTNIPAYSTPALAVDALDNLYVANYSSAQFPDAVLVESYLVQKVTPAGVVTVLP